MIGQIHDEITMDNHADELDFILTQSKKIMCNDIREAWPWIIVPLDIEAEFADVNESWFYKKQVAISEKIEF